MKYSQYIKLVLSIVLLFAIGYFIDWQSLIENLKSANFYWIVGALMLLPINLSIQAFIWQQVLKQVYPHETFSDSFGAIMCGHSLGLFTPARFGDFLGRAYYLPYQNKSQLAALTGLQQLVAYISYTAVGLLALLYLLFVEIKLQGYLWVLIFFISLVVLGFSAFIFQYPGIAFGWISRIPSKRFNKILGFLTHLGKSDLQKILGLTLVRYFVFCTQFYFTLKAFGLAISLFDASVAIALIMFAKTIIPSPTLAELGIREGATIFFLGLFGVPAFIGFNGSLAIFAINILLPACLGIPFILRMKLQVSSSKKAIQAPEVFAK